MLSEVHLARSLLRYGLSRAHAHRLAGRSARGDVGASALEWAVISAILVTAAVVIGGVIYNVVQNKSAQLNNCANQPVGASGC